MKRRKSTPVHIFRRLAVIAPVILLLGQAILPLFTNAQEPSWFDQNSLTLDTLRDNVPSTELPYRTNGNRDCTQQTDITRPHKILPYWPYTQSEQTKQSCSVEAGYGSVDEQSYLQRANTKISGVVKDSAGVQVSVLAVPRTNNLLLLDKSAPNNTVYLHMYRNAYDSLQTTAGLDGSVEHKLIAQPTISLRNGSSQLLGVQTDSLAFSTSGEWAVAEIPGVGLSRINMRTMAITPFALLPLSSPGYSTAVSESGRYAAIASWGYQIFRLYDMNTCTKPMLMLYEQCQYVDLQQYMTQKVPSYMGESRLRFMSDGDLDFYGTRKASGVNAHAHYSLHLLGQITGYGYLGLGDSFSSGEGTYNYRDGTDISDNRCHTSLNSYPYLVGAAAGIGDYNSIACSGAKISHLKDNSEGRQAKLLNNLPTDQQSVETMAPGYVPQLNFISQYGPNVVTLTAGGNDIGFADIVARCVGIDTCYQYREEREQLLNLADTQFDRLVDLYTNLQTAGGKDRIRVYVVGYPQVVYPEGNCAANVHLNQGELYFANELVSYLNSVIKQAAAKAGVFYVDAEHALDGHRLCETQSSDVAVNGVTAGNGTPAWTGSLGPIAIESFHPNVQGHVLLANNIRAATDDLTVEMPVVGQDLTLNKDHTQLPIIVNAPPTPISSIWQDRSAQPYSGGASTLVQGEQTNLAGLSKQQALAPNASYSVEIHSEPVQLGVFSTSSTGELNPSISIPSTVPIGFHTLHIYGKNIAGEDIDLFKTVYVTDSFDAQACGGISKANQDQDLDAIDDACDGFIGDAPPVVTAPQTPEVPSAQPETPIPGSTASADDALGSRSEPLPSSQSPEEQLKPASAQAVPQRLQISAATDHKSTERQTNEAGKAVPPKKGSKKGGLLIILSVFGFIAMVLGGAAKRRMRQK